LSFYGKHLFLSMNVLVFFSSASAPESASGWAATVYYQPLFVIFPMDTAAAPLTGKQKKYLKSLAHPLVPVLQLGKEGLSAQAMAAANIELTRHELIKVKIGGNSGLEKDTTATALVAATGGHLVQVIGKIVVLYRENPKRAKEQRIRLPKD